MHGYWRQLHSSFSERRGRETRLGVGAWCLAMPTADRRRVVTDPRGVPMPLPATGNPQPTQQSPGGVAEWSKAPVLVTGTRKGDEGSNPSFTTERTSDRALPNLNNDRVVPRRWVGRRVIGPTPSSPHARCAATGRWSGALYLCREVELPDA